MKLSTPAVIKQVCENKLRSAWLRRKAGDSVEVIYQTRTTTGREVVALEQLEEWLNKHEVLWADTGADIGTPTPPIGIEKI